MREAAQQQTDNVGSLNKAAASLTRGGVPAELKEKIGRNFSRGLALSPVPPALPNNLRVALRSKPDLHFERDQQLNNGNAFAKWGKLSSCTRSDVPHYPVHLSSACFHTKLWSRGLHDLAAAARCPTVLLRQHCVWLSPRSFDKVAMYCDSMPTSSGRMRKQHAERRSCSDLGSIQRYTVPATGAKPVRPTQL